MLFCYAGLDLFFWLDNNIYAAYVVEFLLLKLGLLISLRKMRRPVILSFVDAKKMFSCPQNHYSFFFLLFFLWTRLTGQRLTNNNNEMLSNKMSKQAWKYSVTSNQGAVERENGPI